MDSEVRQRKQCWIKYREKKDKKIPLIKNAGLILPSGTRLTLMRFTKMYLYHTASSADFSVLFRSLDWGAAMSGHAGCFPCYHLHSGYAGYVSLCTTTLWCAGCISIRSQQHGRAVIIALHRNQCGHGFMYKLYRHKLYREQIVSAQIVSAQFVSAQFVSDTNCIGHQLYRAQIVSCNKLYRGTNRIGPKLYRGTNCIGQKLLITKFLITKFLSNKVPKLQNS